MQACVKETINSTLSWLTCFCDVTGKKMKPCIVCMYVPWLCREMIWKARETLANTEASQDSTAITTELLEGCKSWMREIDQDTSRNHCLSHTYCDNPAPSIHHCYIIMYMCMCTSICVPGLKWEKWEHSLHKERISTVLFSEWSHISTSLYP